jgi:hypothetical protein
MNWSFKARIPRAGLAVVACVAVTVSCDDFLEVQDPSRFTDESLNTPLALAAVANGVEAELLQSIDDFGWRFGQMSDELIHTGTWNPDADRDKGRDPAQVGLPGTGGYQSDLLFRRTSAQKARERFLNVMGDSANRTLLMARVIAVEAWANVYLGMYNCESPKAPLGEIVPSVEMFKLAIPLFTEAANIAKTAGSTNHERWAIAGQARAKLFSADYAGALADAQLIPSSFVYTAKFSATNASNTLVSFAHRSRLKAAGLDTLHWSKVDTIAGFVRDPYTGQHDRRLPITHQPNERGADGVTQYYNQEKFDAVDDDIVQVSGWEMRLIEAEAHLQQGNLAQAMTLINAVRANAGLDPVVATDAAKVKEHLIWERFAQFFLEGMRFYDLHRFNLHGAVLGTGRPTQYPLDPNEITLNPNTNGRLEGRCFPKS